MNANHHHHQHSRSSVPRTRLVWAENVDEQMVCLKEYLKLYPKVAFDTEYPGIIYRTYLDSSDDECYLIMKTNVESSKLIQCGFTLFNAKGEIGGVWEINFSNFGDPWDKRNEKSIDFLKKHGVDLNKIRNEGVDMFKYNFFPKLLNAFYSQKHVEFVTFQGAYDFAYVMSILNHGKLPATRGEFASEVVRVFGDVYDLKVMAGFCDGLGEHLGLSKLAQLLNIPRVGKAHHAGSDSLMTALVFIKLRQVFEDSKFAKGMLYGVGKRMMVTATTTTTMMASSAAASMPMMCQQNLVSYPPSSDMLFHNGYIPSYDDHNQVLFWNHSAVPWMSYDNGMYVNQLSHVPSNTFAYPYQTPYGTDYLGQLPDLLQ